jgi:hypothetical protein
MTTHTPVGKRTIADTETSTGGLAARLQAYSYPRKRVAVACEICRIRKTKCDAKQPSCAFCLEVGVECVYRKGTVAKRHGRVNNRFLHLLS